MNGIFWMCLKLAIWLRLISFHLQKLCLALESFEMKKLLLCTDTVGTWKSYHTFSLALQTLEKARGERTATAAWDMNPNHTVTMNSQPMQRRPYINPRGCAISRNMNHNRMQRFGPQQPHHNHRGNGGNNQNKDLIDCFNSNNSHGWVFRASSLRLSPCLILRFTLKIWKLCILAKALNF